MDLYSGHLQFPPSAPNRQPQHVQLPLPCLLLLGREPHWVQFLLSASNSYWPLACWMLNDFGLTLCGSSAGNHSGGELRSVMAMLCPEASISAPLSMAHILSAPLQGWYLSLALVLLMWHYERTQKSHFPKQRVSSTEAQTEQGDGVLSISHAQNAPKQDIWGGGVIEWANVNSKELESPKLWIFWRSWQIHPSKLLNTTNVTRLKRLKQTDVLPRVELVCGRQLRKT